MAAMRSLLALLAVATADDRVDLEPDRLPIDEDPSDGA